MLPTSSTPQVAIRSVLTEVLPTVLINLVEGYFVFSDATGVLHLGADGKPSDSEANRATLESMQLALTSPECGRDIVRLIFKNAAENGYKSALDELMNQMRLNHQPIILDNVDFSGIDLSGLNLNGASIRNANFTDAILDEASFLGADRHKKSASNQPG